MVKVTILMTLALLATGWHVQQAEAQTKAQADSHFPDVPPQVPFLELKERAASKCKYQSIRSNGQEIATGWQFIATSGQDLYEARSE